MFWQPPILSLVIILSISHLLVGWSKGGAKVTTSHRGQIPCLMGNNLHDIQANKLTLQRLLAHVAIYKTA